MRVLGVTDCAEIVQQFSSPANTAHTCSDHPILSRAGQHACGKHPTRNGLGESRGLWPARRGPVKGERRVFPVKVASFRYAHLYEAACRGSNQMASFFDRTIAGQETQR
jgi:hypothetical protein